MPGLLRQAAVGGIQVGVAVAVEYVMEVAEMKDDEGLAWLSSAHAKQRRGRVARALIGGAW